MATLVRRLCKTLLFIFLFVLALRCMSGTGMMPDSEAMRWWHIAQASDLREPSDVYVPAYTAISLVIAIVVYRLIIKLWRDYRDYEATWKDMQ
jgi:hypothetical protein